ncbi:2-amino-4-hydroxy-6-hydroxymethyldihydropteridine diphosphokinase [Chthonobacter albigriseus]|uniref:2-amino-4-hydroxy-6- hydroxymethyldihydropteridine diphosphokinase n=1 Tax=Chthonobacter albigriseus TaxID=1683161 RepID=UPI001FCE4941|nr:2-amino-4-hydroxy-6-hydroxymethyldihydropteridine diphosphokinase [Chthonobacter albigriseus]
MAEHSAGIPFQMHRPAHAYLSMGGNIGDVRATFEDALALLAERGARVIARSSDYETPPWGKTDQQPFVNACVIVETSLAPHELLDLCLEVEKELGRIRMEKWGPRVIDIDVLAYEGRVIETPDLIVPHRYMLDRAFVLVPLSEIAPDLPIGGVTVAEHAKAFDSTGIVKLPPRAKGNAA